MVRDWQDTNRPVYVAIGVTVNGERDILGLSAWTASMKMMMIAVAMTAPDRD